MAPPDLLYLVRCVPERAQFVGAIAEQLPDLVRFPDTKRHAMTTFLEALDFIGDRRCVMLEDDVELCSDFRARAEAVIAERPEAFITFFNLSKKFRQSRWEPGRKLCMTQCVYLPAGSAPLIRAYYPTWPRRVEHPTGYDYLMADWLQGRKQQYYIHCPSLVQHLPVVSLIDSRRSRARQSPTYVRG